MIIDDESQKSDFVKFYFENKDKRGYLSLEDLYHNFIIKDDNFDISCFPALYQTFKDSNCKNFMKKVHCKNEMDAEITMSKVYNKCGIVSAKYFPVKDDKDNDLYTVSPSIITQGTFKAIPSISILDNDSNALVMKNMPNLMKDINEFFTKDSLRNILLMRLLDVASFNSDRHIDNFFYQLGDVDGEKRVIGVKAIDFSESGILPDNKDPDCSLYYNNYKEEGNIFANATREELVKAFNQEEAVQIFLPRNEASEILGNIDFNQEKREIKEETGYVVNSKLVDAWQKSFDDIANELDK